jgi:hypothetical protein
MSKRIAKPSTISEMMREGKAVDAAAARAVRRAVAESRAQGKGAKRAPGRTTRRFRKAA